MRCLIRLYRRLFGSETNAERVSEMNTVTNPELWWKTEDAQPPLGETLPVQVARLIEETTVLTRVAVELLHRVQEPNYETLFQEIDSICKDRMYPLLREGHASEAIRSDLKAAILNWRKS